MKKLLTMVYLVLAAVSGNVYADPDNYTAINGTGCEAYFATDKPNFDNRYDGIYNRTSSPRWVSCPIDKDAVSSTLGLGTTWVRWAGAGNMQCVLNNFNVNGVRTQSQVGNGAPGWFSMPWLGLDDFWGTNTMYCLVPAFSTLQTVHYFER